MTTSIWHQSVKTSYIKCYQYYFSNYRQKSENGYILSQFSEWESDILIKINFVYYNSQKNCRWIYLSNTVGKHLEKNVVLMEQTKLTSCLIRLLDRKTRKVPWYNRTWSQHNILQMSLSVLVVNRIKFWLIKK